MRFFLIALFGLVFVGCSMTAGGDMNTTTQVNPTVDTKFNNVGE
nr:hypothetical protein DWCPWQHM_DWCPWQHM_CDS_0005 [Microvirus sp.]